MPALPRQSPFAMQQDQTRIAGVILAGGQGSRMHDRNKPLLPLAGKPMVQHVIDRARPQVDTLVISVNSVAPAYRQLGLPLVKDVDTARHGPLTGIFSVMQWCHANASADLLVCFPADVPVFPENLVELLLSAGTGGIGAGEDRVSTGKTVIWCRTGEQVQPLFSLWPINILDELRQAVRQGIHGPRLFFASHPNLAITLPEPQPPLFQNINTPEDLARAETLLGPDVVDHG